MAVSDELTNATPARDRLSTLSKPTTPERVRDRLLELLRRDLVGPHPDFDEDLEREVLKGVSPSNWYLTGYLGPRRLGIAERRVKTAKRTVEEEQSEELLDALRSSEGMEEGAPGPASAPDD